MKAKYPASNIELVKGDGGIFEIRADGKVIYSKQSTGRFPKENEVATLVEQQPK